MENSNVDLHTENIIDLCSGSAMLGVGVSAGLEYFNIRTRTLCYVEREIYAASILAKRMEEGHIPVAPIWSDVKTFADQQGQSCKGLVDGIIGGYPCQPFSAAGMRKGTDDPRHLWPDICRIIATVKPLWCFFENVEGHLTLGFEQVAADLHGMGYVVEAGIFSAQEVGARHRRKRLFILANTESFDGRLQLSTGRPEQPDTELAWTGEAVADTLGVGQERPQPNGTGTRQPETPIGNGSSAGVGQADTCQPGLQRGQQCGSHGERSGPQASGSVAEFHIPLFPPRPNDPRWATIIRHRPDLAPAITDEEAQRVFCRVADGMAEKLEYRADALRLLGNGVVPLCVAYAFVTLAGKIN